MNLDIAEQRLREINHKMSVRRGILQLAAPGASFTVDGDLAEIAKIAEPFAKSRKVAIEIQPRDGGGAVITRVEDTQKNRHTYPMIAQLEPGASVLLKVDPAYHHRVRLAASQLARKTGALFKCTRTGDDITVTRFDGVDTTQISTPKRVTKYDLDRLSIMRELRFELPRADHHKLRLAASMKAKQRGWTVRCRLQDDGSMLVYRTDAGAPLDAQAQAAE